MNAHSRDFRPALPDAIDAERGCAVDGCNNRPFASGWCKGHYLRWYRHGDPTAGRPAGNGDAFAYLSDVVLQYDGDDCLIWPYGTTNGYGVVHFEGRHTFVSTVVCEKVNGPKPSPDHEAAHSCGKGASGCVAKAHLTWKTRKENEADKIAHGSHRRGERSNWAKLSDRQASEIIALKGKMLQREIADLYGINQGQVSRIHSGKRRGWVE